MLFWPELDAAMLIESAQYQQDDGRIPTTVLPIILRDDNIDITQYWVVRVARHYQYYGNLTLLVQLYPAVQRAMVYLRGRDYAGVGVPAAMNTSFWADWLDVDYIQGRRFAPHYYLLWLACCKVGAQMAGVLGNSGDAARWTEWYQQGFDFVNADFKWVVVVCVSGWW